MDYIIASKFLKQPEKVKKVFRNWWKPQMYDLFFRDFGNNPNKYLNGVYKGCIRDNETLNSATKDKTFLPLLIETQLRKFIGEHYKYIETNNFKDKKQIVLVYKDLSQTKPSIECISNDLLNAYWKVACQIAEDATND